MAHPENKNADEKRKQERPEAKPENESDGTFYENWKEGKNMGNDVTSEIKIANSGGTMEGGSDKVWHMDENSEKGDEELKQ